jgi:hypothetical protein
MARAAGLSGLLERKLDRGGERLSLYRDGNVSYGSFRRYRS